MLATFLKTLRLISVRVIMIEVEYSNFIEYYNNTLGLPVPTVVTQ